MAKTVPIKKLQKPRMVVKLDQSMHSGHGFYLMKKFSFSFWDT